MKGIWEFAIVVSASHAQAMSTASLTAAAATVADTAGSAPSLFDNERVQLTEGVLADVSAALQNNSVASMFAFASSSSEPTVAKRRQRHSCKVMAGDFWWPVDLVWDVFDLLLGSSLIKTVPLASYCYPDWPG